MTTATVLDSLSYLSEGQATRWWATGGNARPTVSVAVGGGDGTSVNIDYGTGITGPGGTVRSGAIDVVYDRGSHTGSVTFQNYAVNGRTVSGTVSLSFLSITSEMVSFVAGIDMEVKGVSSVEGNQSVSLTSGLASFPSGNITVTPASGVAYTLSVNSLTLSPTTHGDFIPSGGVITVPYPYTLPGGSNATATVAITFNDQSPVTGVVSVSVNGGPQVVYTLAARQSTSL